jgi:hypothetical protein
MKGLIYKITDNETNEVYIGSTIRTIKARINQHRGQKECRAHSIIIRDNYRVKILEEIDIDNIIDNKLKKCEQKHMDKCHNLINKNRAFGSGNDKEYYQNYYQKNKEKYKQRNGDRKAQYAWRKTWGDTTHNLIDINMNVFH